MSNLIVMPGSSEFAETVKSVDLKHPARSVFGGRILSPATPANPNESLDEPPVDPNDLCGHTLMLNTAVVRRFQCGGFQLSLNRPFATVDHGAQQEPLRRALAAGELVDITGHDPKKGFKTRQGAVSAIELEDTEKRVFIGQDKDGRMFVAIPKNKKQAAQYDRQIKRNGTLTNLDGVEEVTSGFSRITTEDVPLDARGRIIMPGSQPTRGKTSARSPRNKRESRRG